MTVIDILPPEPARERARRFHRGSGSVADAQFVTVKSSVPPKSGTSKARHAMKMDKPGPGNPAPLLAVRAERALSRLSADMFSAVVALVFVVVFALAGGFSLFLGKAGTETGVSALDFTHVTLTQHDASGMQVLLINGIVENSGIERLPLPSIRAELVSGDQILATAVIEPPVREIEGRHSHGFSARVPHPGGKSPELRLSFAGRGA